MDAFFILYAIVCSVIIVHAVRVLLNMTARTNHVRRSAFVLFGFGAVVGFLECMHEVSPLTSMLILLMGFLLLVSAGLRYGKRTPPPSTIHRDRNHAA